MRPHWPPRSSINRITDFSSLAINSAWWSCKVENAEPDVFSISLVVSSVIRDFGQAPRTISTFCWYVCISSLDGSKLGTSVDSWFVICWSARSPPEDSVMINGPGCSLLRELRYQCKWGSTTVCLSSCADRRDLFHFASNESVKGRPRPPWWKERTRSLDAPLWLKGQPKKTSPALHRARLEPGCTGIGQGEWWGCLTKRMHIIRSGCNDKWIISNWFENYNIYIYTNILHASHPGWEKYIEIPRLFKCLSNLWPQVHSPARLALWLVYLGALLQRNRGPLRWGSVAINDMQWSQ